MLESRMKEICETRVRATGIVVCTSSCCARAGRSITVGGDGGPSGAAKATETVHRVYKELGLQLRNKKPKRRVKAKLRENREEAGAENEVWAMDFVHDQLATGRKLRVLTVVDTWSKVSPVVDPRFSYRGEDVVRTLDEACARVGYPRTIRVDLGTEFVSRDLDLWAYQRDVTLDFSRPGKPTDNAFIERSTASSVRNASTYTGS